MKIVLANYRYYVSGGPEVYMFNVKRLLEDAGHVVVPYSVRSPLNEETPYSRYFPHGKSESGDAYFDDVRKTPRNVARLLSCAFYNREAYRNLRRLIRDEKPDVVYVLQQVNALSPSVFRAAHDEGVRVVHRLSDFNMMCPRSDFLCDGEVCTSCLHGDYAKARKSRCCHGSRATTEVRVASMRFHRSHRLFDCVDMFVCPTRFTADLLTESGVAASKVAVIPTFTAPATAGLGRASGGEGYALYLGRISPEKGVDLLVDAAIANPALRLKVTGRTDDPYSAGLKERVEEAGASGRIEFVGFVSGAEKEALVSGASCVCCPSTWFENLPNAVLEAYAHAKPVVAFDVGCMPELVRDGVTGTVVPLGDVSGLGEAVAALCDDRGRACGMGIVGLGLASSEYSPESHLSRLVDALMPPKARKD